MAKKPEKTVAAEPSAGPCEGGCGTKCDAGNYCFGCKTFWCETCDVSCGNYPWGGHAPNAHLIPYGE